ncbi:ABC transporter permease [Acidobacteria bacterium AH-259-A15]|nr:ABC transporter permease [Acidobacteria bacterium AH-259-A15]
MQLWHFFLTNFEEVLTLTGQHLWMVFVSIAAASAIGIPAGVLITRRPRLEKSVLGFANVVQTIPSLALFGFLIPVPILGGIGAGTAILALVLYALLPIVRSTYAGVKGVDPSVKEAGRGMGMTDGQLLWQVELPLALGVILAGVRVAAITSVGIATIAAAIGAGGLGMYIFRGVAGVNTTLILAGSIPAALLALLTDFSLGRIERRLAGRRSSRPDMERRAV